VTGAGAAEQDGKGVHHPVNDLTDLLHRVRAIQMIGGEALTSGVFSSFLNEFPVRRLYRQRPGWQERQGER